MASLWTQLTCLAAICGLANGFFQEEPCVGMGGTCLDENGSCGCPGGTFQSSKCPTQPSNIKCCVPSGGSGACPRVITRAEWRARAPKRRSTLRVTPAIWFIHHSVTSTCNSVSTCASRIRGMQNYHMDTLGWNDIGYSFLVGDDGNIYEGRGFGTVGSHTGGFNTRSYATCFIGDFTSRAPSAAALAAAQAHIRCAQADGKITSGYRIYGHRQVRATACPGNTLFPIVQTWPRWASGSPA